MLTADNPAVYTVQFVQDGAYGRDTWPFADIERPWIGDPVLRPCSTVHLIEVQPDGVERECRMVVSREMGRQIRRALRNGEPCLGHRRSPAPVI